VRAAYGVSWAYLTGDVAYEGYKAYLRNERVRNPHLYPQEADGEEGKKGVVGEKLTKRMEAVVGSERLAKGTEMVRRAGTKVGVLEEGGRGKEEKLEVERGHVPAIEDWRSVMAQRAVFQGVASMGLPAFTIHSVVKYSGRAMKDVKNVRIRTWGPIGVSVHPSLLLCAFGWIGILILSLARSRGRSVLTVYIR